MKYLIFEPEYGGHRLEYMHHIYMYAGEAMKTSQFILLLNPKMRNSLQFLEWPKFENVKIEYFNQEEVIKFEIGSLLSRSYNKNKILSKYFKIYKPDKILLDTLISYMPFLPLFLRAKQLVSGIIYRIPRYAENRSYIRRAVDNLNFRMFSKLNVFDCVFLLNDKKSSYYYNDRYNTNKFKCLPDPIVIRDGDNKKEEYSIPTIGKRKVFLHAGGMGERKGTFTILKAIELMTKEEREKCLFIFSGAINNETERSLMLSFVKKYSDESSIIYTDRFVPFDELAYYYSVSNYVLIPYYNVQQSSGVLGTSAYYKKPVIGPKEGLLGELIDDFKLGFTIPEITPVKLKDSIIECTSNDYYQENFGFNQYAEINTISNFAKTLFGEI